MRSAVILPAALLLLWVQAGETKYSFSPNSIASKLGEYRPSKPSPGTDDQSAKLATVSHENFEMPKPYTERYMANMPTDSGGLFTESFSLHHCHQRKIKTGKCNNGCYDKIPGSSNCFVYSADDECLCIDPCRLFGEPKHDKVSGDVLPGSGCESCVRHKSHNYFDYRNVPAVRPTRNFPRLRPSWVYKSRKISRTIFDLQCGMCETRCVAASKTGPKFESEECVGEWKWKLSDCRRMEVTQEQLSKGSDSSSLETFVPGDTGKQNDPATPDKEKEVT